MKKKLANIVGICFMIISIIFLSKKILSYKISISYIRTHVGINMFLILLIIYSLFYLISSLSWCLYIHNFIEKKISVFEEIYIFQKSNLMKYIPGNIWQYVGRNEIALRNNVPHKKVVYATICDIATMAMTAFLWVVFLMHSEIIKLASKLLIRYTILGTVVIFSAIIVSIVGVYYFYHKNILKKKLILTFLKSFFIYTLFLIGSAFLFLLLFTYFKSKQELTFLQDIQFLGSYITSWLAGYVVPGAPGGVGIRESVMCILTKGIFEQKDILSTLIVFRIITTLGEMVSFLGSFLLLKINKIKDKNREGK